MIKYVDDNVKWQTKDISNSIILTGEAHHSMEACALVAYRIVTVWEWKQKEKPMENDMLMCDCVLRECHAIVIEFVALLFSYIGIELLHFYLKIIV